MRKLWGPRRINSLAVKGPIGTATKVGDCYSDNTKRVGASYGVCFVL